MGCDIHLYKEKQVDGVWVTADEGWADEYNEGWLDVPFDKRFTDRDYDLFGFLSSGVRRNHSFSFSVRGVPFDGCKEVHGLFKQWGSDGHSHSYLYLHELKSAWKFLESQTVTITGMKNKAEIKLLMDSINSDEETDWHLLYPYCQSANHLDYDDFSVDVPATYSLSGLQTIISLFDGIDGDNHRIVFCFDN